MPECLTTAKMGCILKLIVFWNRVIKFASGFKIPDFKEGFDLFPLFGVPFVLIGLAMHGNVWELCRDWYGVWYGSKYPPGTVTDPSGPRSGSHRVYRGGSWNNSPQNCRSAYRNYNTPSNRNNNLGFRVARSFAGRVDACQTKPAAFRSEPCLRCSGKTDRDRPVLVVL